MRSRIINQSCVCPSTYYLSTGIPTAINDYLIYLHAGIALSHIIAPSFRLLMHPPLCMGQTSLTVVGDP